MEKMVGQERSSNVIVTCPDCGFEQIIAVKSLKFYRCSSCHKQFKFWVLAAFGFVKPATKEDSALAQMKVAKFAVNRSGRWF